MLRVGLRLLRRQIPKLSHVPTAPTASQAAMREILRQRLQSIRDREAKYKYSCRPTGDQSKTLDFGTEDYLGLTRHPDVIRAGMEAMKRVYQAGVNACFENMTMLQNLEEKMARFHDREDAVLFSSNFGASRSLFQAVLTSQDDVIICDHDNGPSLTEGVRLIETGKIVHYKHLDMKDLEVKLQESRDARTCYVVTEGVFSEDGRITPLREICHLADKYNVLVVVDESLAAGALGRTGRGTEEHYGLENKPAAVLLSSLGAVLEDAPGAYAVGSKDLMQTLRKHQSRPESSLLAPYIVGSACKVFELITNSSVFVEKLSTNTRRFRNRMRDAGFLLMGYEHPRTRVLVEDAKLAAVFVRQLAEKGVLVESVSSNFGTLTEGNARITVHLSASHTVHDVDCLVEAFVDIGRHLNVIPRT